MQVIHDLYNHWEANILKYRDEPSIEIEVRLGKMNRGTFDTNIGKQTFETVLRRLRKFDAWDSVHESQCTVYYDQATSKRVTMNDITDEMESSVVKKRVLVDDFSLEGFPFDVRLGISTEVPYDRETSSDEENFTRVKKKKRWSFVRKGLSIDMTEVSGEADDKDTEEETVYQIELEILNPTQSIEQRHQLYNMLYKITDISKIM